MASAKKKRDGGGPVCATLPQSILQKIESKFVIKDGIDGISSCLCSISKNYPEFLKRPLFLRMMSSFRRLKARGRYEFLQAVYNSTDIFPVNSPANSGNMGVVDHLRPFLAGLLADLSTVVLRYDDGDSNSKSDPSPPPRIRLPMIQLLTIKILTRHAKSLDVELLEMLVQGFTPQNGDDFNVSPEGGHGLALVLSEKAVLKVCVYCLSCVLLAVITWLLDSCGPYLKLFLRHTFHGKCNTNLESNNAMEYLSNIHLDVVCTVLY